MKDILKRLKKFNSNNSGVTLVELIIAVVVLSISIGPLLYTFVFSTKFNAESKVRQRSTAAAQTVMESFKAYDVADICSMFDGSAPVDPVTGAAPTFLKNNTATYKFTQSVTSTNAAIGTYEIQGMTLADAVTGQPGRYDAVIEVTEAMTTTEMPEVPVYDPRQDALWEETFSNYGSTYYDPYYVATSAVRSAVVNAGYNPDDIIRVDISREISLIFDNTTAFVQYMYPYEIWMSGMSVNLTGSVVYSARPMTKDGAALSMPLRNIYFYYYPAYKDSYVSSSTVNVKQDILKVTNTANADVNLFINKQLDTVRSTYDLSSCESTYKLYCASVGSAYTTTIYDSIQANLSSFKGGTATSVPSMLINYTGVGDGNIVIQSTIGPVESGVLSYNVVVKVYNIGDRSDVLSEIHGTVLK